MFKTGTEISAGNIMAAITNAGIFISNYFNIIV
jgi:hypothetical protein